MEILASAQPISPVSTPTALPEIRLSHRVQSALDLLSEANVIVGRVMAAESDRREKEVARRQERRAMRDAAISVSVPVGPVESAFVAADAAISLGMSLAIDAAARGLIDETILGSLRGANRVAMGALRTIQPEHASSVHEEITQVCQLLAESTHDHAAAVAAAGAR